tara:strand:+ start:404 stop:1006 length:603 start_codon:yes stop_codon:yes gene_type:complete
MQPYYQDDFVTIYHGDNRDVVPVIEYDSVVTDPPYGKNLNYGEESSDTRDWFIEHAKWLVGLDSPLIFTCPSSRLYEIPKPDWIGVWHKPMSFGFWNTPMLPHWEAMCIYNQPEKISRSDVFVSNPAKPIVKGHPAPKPLSLWREVMVAFGEGVVLDPFMGSGTTLRAAKDLGVKAIGIEIEERFCEISANRMSQLAMQL